MMSVHSCENLIFTVNLCFCQMRFQRGSPVKTHLRGLAVRTHDVSPVNKPLRLGSRFCVFILVIYLYKTFLLRAEVLRSRGGQGIKLSPINLIFTVFRRQLIFTVTRELIFTVSRRLTATRLDAFAWRLYLRHALFPSSDLLMTCNLMLVYRGDPVEHQRAENIMISIAFESFICFEVSIWLDATSLC